MKKPLPVLVSCPKCRAVSYSVLPFGSSAQIGWQIRCLKCRHRYVRLFASERTARFAYNEDSIQLAFYVTRYA